MVMSNVLDEIVDEYGANVAQNYNEFLQKELTDFVDNSVKYLFAQQNTFRRIAEAKVYLDELNMPTVELGLFVEGEYISVHEWIDRDSLVRRKLKQGIK